MKALDPLGMKLDWPTGSNLTKKKAANSNFGSARGLGCTVSLVSSLQPPCPDQQAPYIAIHISPPTSNTEMHLSFSFF
jgi:hypothetical protein